MAGIGYTVVGDTCGWFLAHNSLQTFFFYNQQVLTASIVIGWLLSVLTLGQWSSLGYVKGVLGGKRHCKLCYSYTHLFTRVLFRLPASPVSSVYALIFGLLGLIPVPKAGRK